MSEMLSVEESRSLVLSHVNVLSAEHVDILDAAGRVAAADLKSDIDIAPFAHSAMDGFAICAADLELATSESPVEYDVIAEIAAGDTYYGDIEPGQCVRIMTGAPMPEHVDSVVKYEIVDVVSGDGRLGSRVAFTAPTKLKSNVRDAGEEARAGETIVVQGEVINAAGVGFLAGCGVVEAPVYRHPKIAIIAIGSELVDPSELPTPGKIRNSNSYALAACARAAGAVPEILPIVEDTHEALAAAVLEATKTFDFVVTSGGASNGDYDFIKPVVEDLGELYLTTVNMRPGKAQTFGIVNETPVFGLPGNPAAAYLGFEILIRPALRKMQGYSHFDRPVIEAKLSKDVKKKDPRCFYMRATLSKDEAGEYVVEPARNQSSGLFGVIQRSNCMIVFPAGAGFYNQEEVVQCVILDVNEEVCL